MEAEENKETLTEEQAAEVARKARNAAKQRERVAQLNALGLTSRGTPKKRFIKKRDPVKQRRWQASYQNRSKAARKRLGLTIEQFMALPKATRLMEMGPSTAGKPAPRRRIKEPFVYNNEMEAAAAARPVAQGIKFCPECGHNLQQYNRR